MSLLSFSFRELAIVDLPVRSQLVACALIKRNALRNSKPIELSEYCKLKPSLRGGMDKLRKSKTLKKLRTLFGQSKRTRGSAPRSPVGTSCDVVEVWIPYDLSANFIYNCFYYGRGRYLLLQINLTPHYVYLRLLIYNVLFSPSENRAMGDQVWFMQQSLYSWSFLHGVYSLHQRFRYIT